MFAELRPEQVDEMLAGVSGVSRQQKVESFFSETYSRFDRRTRQLVPGAEIFSIDIGYASRGGKRKFYFTHLSPTEGNDGIAARTFRWNKVRAEGDANVDFKKPAVFVTYRIGNGAYTQEVIPWNRDDNNGYGPSRPGFIQK